MATIKIPISYGELADKLTILEIKLERINDVGRLHNVRVECDSLLPLWQPLEAKTAELAELKAQLKAVNERMWDIQDALRDKEKAQMFDDEFVRLARAVAPTNGERVALKNTINRLAGSQLIEEKQYAGEGEAGA
jgi:hypothetical protein